MHKNHDAFFKPEMNDLQVFFQEITLPSIGMGHWNQGLINAVVLPEGKA